MYVGVFLILKFMGPSLKTWDILNLRKIKCSPRMGPVLFFAWLTLWVVHTCMAACVSVYLCVCVCVCVWLETLSLLYYTKTQKTRGLIRETFQTLALGDIDSLSVDRVDQSCPEWLLLPKCSILPPPTSQPDHFEWLLVIISNNWNLIWRPLLPERYWSCLKVDAV